MYVREIMQKILYLFLQYVWDCVHFWFIVIFREEFCRKYFGAIKFSLDLEMLPNKGDETDTQKDGQGLDNMAKAALLLAVANIICNCFSFS